MFLDSRLEFADAVQITFGAGTNLIGDVIDLGTPARDIGQGQTLYLALQVSVAFAGGTAMQFILASDSAAAIATSGAETRHYLSDVFLDATLIQSFAMMIPLPMGDVAASVTPYERYVGILGVGTGTHTAGSIDAFLTIDPRGWRAYPDAVN